MPRFDSVIGQQPRFALATPRFRFRALAACAGRASIGGDREVAMACLVAGRLAAALLPPYAIGAADLKARSTGAKHWLASLSLPAPVRSALTHLADAVGVGNRNTSAGALSHLVMVAQRSIDEASASELIGVAAALEAEG
ncbi:MAG: hypothetical protein M3O61_16210 [Gemmatimonadota bacterium]|nr:hypothetical protein [Gemmatimonadota bacterium]